MEPLRRHNSNHDEKCQDSELSNQEWRLGLLRSQRMQRRNLEEGLHDPDENIEVEGLVRRQEVIEGKPKPVTLVATVVARKSAVQPSSRFPVSSPKTTTNPDAIPTRLIKTCTRVNVDVVIPTIMSCILSREHAADVGHDPFIRLPQNMCYGVSRFMPASGGTVGTREQLYASLQT
jgi:hypothetical protein